MNEDRRLLVETLAELKELKGEIKEFKKNMIGRAKLLEKNKLSIGNIDTHNLVVGWQGYPLQCIKNPALFNEFKDRV